MRLLAPMRLRAWASSAARHAAQVHFIGAVHEMQPRPQVRNWASGVSGDRPMAPNTWMARSSTLLLELRSHHLMAATRAYLRHAGRHRPGPASRRFAAPAGGPGRWRCALAPASPHVGLLAQVFCQSASLKARSAANCRASSHWPRAHAVVHAPRSQPAWDHGRNLRPSRPAGGRAVTHLQQDLAVPFGRVRMVQYADVAQHPHAGASSAAPEPCCAGGESPAWPLPRHRYWWHSTISSLTMRVRRAGDEPFAPSAPPACRPRAARWSAGWGSDEATSGSDIAKAERMWPCSSGLQPLLALCQAGKTVQQPMLPVSGALQLNTSAAQVHGPWIWPAVHIPNATGACLVRHRAAGQEQVPQALPRAPGLEVFHGAQIRTPAPRGARPGQQVAPTSIHALAQRLGPARSMAHLVRRSNASSLTRR